MTVTDQNNAETETARRYIEVNRALWRQVRAQAVLEGKTVSEKFDDILRQHVNEENKNIKSK